MELENIIEVITNIVKEEIFLMDYKVPVGISARHVHLSQEAIEVLFGKGYELTVFKPIKQPNQYASNEFVDLIGSKGEISRVRILGPARKDVQVEISASDARKLGVKPVVRGSGDIANTPSLKLRGPKGEYTIQEGVIVAERHVHMTPANASVVGVADGDKVSVEIEGEKGGILGNVVVRVSEAYKLELHIDTDDASAFLVSPNSFVKIIK